MYILYDFLYTFLSVLNVISVIEREINQSTVISISDYINTYL